MEEIKETIKKLHKMYYDEDGPFKTPESTMQFHDLMEILFNYAEITETLCENNPDGMTREKFLDITKGH